MMIDTTRLPERPSVWRELAPAWTCGTQTDRQRSPPDELPSSPGIGSRSPCRACPRRCPRVCPHARRRARFPRHSAGQLRTGRPHTPSRHRTHARTYVPTPDDVCRQSGRSAHTYESSHRWPAICAKAGRCVRGQSCRGNGRSASLRGTKSAQRDRELLQEVVARLDPGLHARRQHRVPVLFRRHLGEQGERRTPI